MKEKEHSKHIIAIPAAVTLANGFCGFCAIMIVSHEPALSWQLPLFPGVHLTYPAIAAWFIFFGMIADILDGSVARATGASSNFGAQLDSLCDAVSFGIAPALLSYKMFALELSKLRDMSFQFKSLIGPWIIFSAMFYAICAIVRLARFNVENEEDDSSHAEFTGLPSTPSAGLICSLVLFHETGLHWLVLRLPFIVPYAAGIEKVTLWSIPFALLITGVLMVSRIIYPHVVYKLQRKIKLFPAVVIFVIIAFFLFWNIYVALLIGLCVFTLYGPIRHIVKHKRQTS